MSPSDGICHLCAHIHVRLVKLVGARTGFLRLNLNYADQSRLLSYCFWFRQVSNVRTLWRSKGAAGHVVIYCFGIRGRVAHA